MRIGFILNFALRAGLHLKASSRYGHDARHMSLNRSEQMMGDYVDENPEELRYWQDKVKSTVAEERDRHVAAGLLAKSLSDYFGERASVVPSFRELADGQGVRPTSLKNLAEYWIRLWAPPPPKKKKKDPWAS